MKRQRLVMMAVGAAVSLSLVIVAGLLLLPAARTALKVTKARCTRSTAIRVMYYCGKKVVWVNPDGSRVVIGTTKQLESYHPLPVRMAVRP